MKKKKYPIKSFELCNKCKFNDYCKTSDLCFKCEQWNCNRCACLSVELGEPCKMFEKAV